MKEQWETLEDVHSDQGSVRNCVYKRQSSNFSKRGRMKGKLSDDWGYGAVT